MNLFAQYKQEAQLAEAEYTKVPKKSDIPAIIRKKQDPKNWQLTLNDMEKERTQYISHIQTPGAQKIKEAAGRLQATVTPAGSSITSTTGRIKATITPGSADTAIEPAEPKDSLKLKLDPKLSSVKEAADQSKIDAARAAITAATGLQPKVATKPEVTPAADKFELEAPKFKSEADRTASIARAKNRSSSALYGESVGYAHYLDAALIRFGVSSISELDEEIVHEFLKQIDEAFTSNNVEYITRANQYLAIMEQINVEHGESNIISVSLDADQNYVVEVEKDTAITQHLYQFDK